MEVRRMELYCQLMKAERGDEPLESPLALEASDMEEAQSKAQGRFATARQMATSRGDSPPEAIRILEHEVELWRWTWSQENSAPHRKGS
jgi:hypothetical protein